MCSQILMVLSISQINDQRGFQFYQFVCFLRSDSNIKCMSNKQILQFYLGQNSLKIKQVRVCKIQRLNINPYLLLILFLKLMRKLTIIFWTIFWLFVYKLAYLERQQPTTDRKFAIVRDQQGVPHVYAKNYKDILFGLGYAEAQDRLFSIFFKKMLIQGRTSQLFGPDAVTCDLEMRNLGLFETGKTNKLHTDPETLQLLQAYADGINSYAKTTKMLPFQFYLFWLNWEDWKVEDTLATINLLSFVLQFDWFYEIARQRLLETVGFDLARKIMSYGGDNLFRSTTIISDEELKELGKYQAYSFQHQKEVLKKHWANKNITLGSVHFPQIHTALEGSGSNSWTIGKQHTLHGKPILANDPHVGTILPNMFYHFEVVLLAKDNTIKSRKFGAMPDGIPTLSLGISELTAWSATAAYIDNKDVYYETVRNNSGKMQYLFKDEWLDFRQRKETIKVRGAKDIEETFYHTHRGVVIETIFMDIHWKYGYPMPSQYKDNHTLTLVATHFRPDNSSAKGLVNLLTFETFEQFDQIRNYIKHPNIDGTCIYPNGSFAYYGVGGIPRRKIPEMGSFIKDGNSDEYQMGDDLSAAETLIILDRKQGYVSMANNRFASDNYKYRSSLHQITTGRSYFLDKFIKEKIQRKQKFSFDDIKSLQLNQKDQFLAEVLPKFTSKLTELRKVWSNPQTEILFEKLIKWDAIISRDSVQASIYHVFQHLFHYSLFTLTNLTEFQRTSIVTHAFFQNFYFGLLQKFGNGKLASQDKILCQSFETTNYPHLHACEASIALAFKKLPSELNKLFGSDNVEGYQWGKIHKQTFKSVPFSDVPLLNHLWNRDFPAGGNSRTLNVAISAYQAKKYDSIGSAAFRFITDLNTTYYSIQAGQNDRIFSSHFDQFIDKNIYLEYHPRNPLVQGLPKGWQFYVNLLE